MNFDKIIPLIAGIVIATATVGKLDALTLWVYKAQAKLVYESRASAWGSPRFFPQHLTKSNKINNLTREVTYDTYKKR
jgi:hypothetical protein